MPNIRLSAWVAVVMLSLGVATTAVAQTKPSVSKKVGVPLRAAQKALEKENWVECVSQLRKAGEIPDRNEYDSFAINELLGFCAARLDDLATAAQAFEAALDSGFLDPGIVNLRHRQLLQVNYNLKNYAKAADFGKRAIALGDQEEDVFILTAQSHYLLEDFSTTRVFARDWITGLQSRGGSPPEIAVQLYLSSCIRLQDDPCTMDALEKQARFHPRPETWPNLILMVFRQAEEAQTLDVFRLAFARDALRRAEEYTEMAQLSLERGLPGEAQTVLEAGAAKGLFTEARPKELADRLLNSARNQGRQDRAELDRQAAQSVSGSNGQVDVRVGQAYLSYGEPQKAIEAIERGLGKGNVRNVPDAQLSLGIAQLRAGHRQEAGAAFDAVAGNTTLEQLARLWKIESP